ncbi:MAG: hypothetical protein KA163_02690 [Bacteroidia bacterium]|nr:hypothetical protein [Bacteroidia bacterium]
MKKIFLVFVFIYNFGLTMSGQNSVISSDESFVIGLSKISHVQLQFVKSDLEIMSKISSAEFVFNDNILIIKPDYTDTSLLEYAEIEKILLKYFNQADIHKKGNLKTSELQAQYAKTDKYIIK